MPGAPLQSFLFVPAVSSGAFFGVLPKEEGERGEAGAHHAHFHSLRTEEEDLPACCTILMSPQEEEEEKCAGTCNRTKGNGKTRNFPK